MRRVPILARVSETHLSPQITNALGVEDSKLGVGQEPSKRIRGLPRRTARGKATWSVPRIRPCLDQLPSRRSCTTSRLTPRRPVGDWRYHRRFGWWLCARLQEGAAHALYQYGCARHFRRRIHPSSYCAPRVDLRGPIIIVTIFGGWGCVVPRSPAGISFCRRGGRGKPPSIN